MYKDHMQKHCSSASDILELLVHIPPHLVEPQKLIAASLKSKVRKTDIEKIRIKFQGSFLDNMTIISTDNDIQDIGDIDDIDDVNESVEDLNS